jgi:hypothetical protein
MFLSFLFFPDRELTEMVNLLKGMEKTGEKEIFFSRRAHTHAHTLTLT